MDEAGASELVSRTSAGIAGFWRRLLAAFLDGIILGAPAFLLGLVLFDVFASFGSWGRLIGFVISLLYFALLNSALGGGQTIGKRAAAIRVVDAQDRPIGLARSSARTAILIAPWFLNGALHDPALLLSWVGLAAAVVVFGFGLSNIYLLVFNRRNRRGLHDLLAGTYVVRAAHENATAAPPTWRGHYVVVALVIAATLAVPQLLKPLTEKEPFCGLLQVQSALLKVPAVRAASVFAGANISSSNQGPRTTSVCNVSAATRTRSADPDALANQIARIVIDQYPEARRLDAIVVTLAYGYDLGIASGSTSQTFRHSPAEWEQRIQSSLPSSL